MSHALRGNYKGPQFGGTLSLNGLISTDEFKNEQRFLSPVSDERVRQPVGKRSRRDRRQLPDQAGPGSRVGNAWPRSSSRSEAWMQLASSWIRRALILTPRSSSRSERKRASGLDARYCATRCRLNCPSRAAARSPTTIANNRSRSPSMACRSRCLLPTCWSRKRAANCLCRARGGLRRSGRWKAACASSSRRSRNRATPSKERSFTYPKPRLVGTWSPTEDDQLRLRVEREVGPAELPGLRVGGGPQLAVSRTPATPISSRRKPGSTRPPTRSASGMAPLRFSRFATRTSRTWSICSRAAFRSTRMTMASTTPRR